MPVFETDFLRAYPSCTNNDGNHEEDGDTDNFDAGGAVLAY